jgi:hypothetical protein
MAIHVILNWWNNSKVVTGNGDFATFEEKILDGLGELAVINLGQKFDQLPAWHKHK